MCGQKRRNSHILRGVYQYLTKCVLFEDDEANLVWSTRTPKSVIHLLSTDSMRLPIRALEIFSTLQKV